MEAEFCGSWLAYDRINRVPLIDRAARIAA